MIDTKPLLEKPHSKSCKFARVNVALFTLLLLGLVASRVTNISTGSLESSVSNPGSTLSQSPDARLETPLGADAPKGEENAPSKEKKNDSKEKEKSPDNGGDQKAKGDNASADGDKAGKGKAEDSKENQDQAKEDDHPGIPNPKCPPCVPLPFFSK